MNWERLHGLWIEKKEKRAEIATALKMKENTVYSRIYRKTLRIEDLLKICKIYKMSPCLFIKDEIPR